MAGWYRILISTKCIVGWTEKVKGVDHVTIFRMESHKKEKFDEHMATHDGRCLECLVSSVQAWWPYSVIALPQRLSIFLFCNMVVLLL